MFSFRYHRNTKENVAKKEVHAASFIPYANQINDTTIHLKNNWIMKVIKLDGYPFETADDEDVDINKSVRNQLFKTITSNNFGFYFHIIRKKNTHDDPLFSKRIPNYFADYIRKRWKQKHANKNNFTNELYLTIIRKNDSQGLEFFSNLWHKIAVGRSEESLFLSLKLANDELEEMTNRILITLRNYSPRVLGIKRERNFVFSEVLTFLRKIVNCSLDENRFLAPLCELDRYLPSNRLFFGDKAIEIVEAKGRRYAGIVSLKEYGQSTSAGILDAFLQVPYELIISQTFQFVNRRVAINKMQIQQNRMLQTQDKAISQIAEITHALDDATSGRVAFGIHNLSVLCIDDNMKGLDNGLSIIETELANAGLYPVREKVNLEPSFWGQMPGNFDFIARKATISTLNLAALSSFHNYPTGKKSNNHWGDAVTVFNTTSGTPFYFNFHLKDVGHTMIIGPTGAGKTVLMNFLCAQAMKFRPRLFFFDKDHGAEIFIRALGGIYTVIEAQTKAFLNPLQLEDTSDNRTFLIDWFKRLVSVNDEKISADDLSKINDAINGNFKLEKKDRVLNNLAPFLGLDGPDKLAGRMRMWHSGGSHSSLFDEVEDKLNLSESRVFGFEMGHLLKDEASLGPVLLYLFHRISISLDGSPTMIVLDEAWALIDNSIFAPKIKDWLKVLRKLNTFVIFATQSVEDASKSKISDTLIQQTATQIFLPNLKATQIYRSVFMLSEREYVLIKNTDPATRFFLIKQGINAVVARIDLSGMDDIISVLSGRVESVLVLRKILEKYGSKPENWLSAFCKEVKNV